MDLPSASVEVSPVLVTSKKKGRPNHNLKRRLDVFLCLLGLPLALPLGAIAALLSAVSCKASPIYRQERIGRNGKPFTLYKFRSMIKNADHILDQCLKNNPDFESEWKKDQKLRDDPRLTRIGRFLRKTSLDELPQIINILKGDMSLVGPRPIVAGEREKYGRFFDEYCQTRPGLTGLWQVSGRNNTTYAQRVAFDHYYINNWTIWLDLWILAKTAPAAVSGNGAY